MIDLYSPRGEMELLILRSILEDAGIPLFVRNDTFGSLYPGRYSEAYNRKTICVPEAAGPEARVLVREFLQRTGQLRTPAGPAAGRAGQATAAGALDEGPAGWRGALLRWWRKLAAELPLPPLGGSHPDTPEQRRRRFRLIDGERSPMPSTAAETCGPDPRSGTAAPDSLAPDSPAPSPSPERPPLRLV